MITQTLARIAGYAAKAVYLLIYSRGTATVEEMREAGFTHSVIHRLVADLQVGGFIVRVGVGSYRAVESHGRDSESHGQDSSPVFPESHGRDSESHRRDSDVKTEILLESMSPTGGTQKVKKSRPRDSESRGRDFSSSAVNVVNNVNSTNKHNGKIAKISSTKELVSFLDGLSEVESGKYLRVFGVVQGLIPFAVSPDIVQRLAAVPFVFGVSLPIDLLHDWIKEAKSAARCGKVKVEWMAFAQSVKFFYEEKGVKWTKCRPALMVAAENKLKALTVIMPGGEQSAEEFLEFKDCDNMERHVKPNVFGELREQLERKLGEKR